MKSHSFALLVLMLAACGDAGSSQPDSQDFPAAGSSATGGQDSPATVGMSSDEACEAVTVFVMEAIRDYEAPPPGTPLYHATTLVFRGGPEDSSSALRCPGVLSIVEEKEIPYGEDAVAWALDVPRGDTFKAKILTIGRPRSTGPGQVVFTEEWLAAPLGGEEHEVEMVKKDGKWAITARRQTKIY